MTRRRFAAVALALATFAGCHEDPNVQKVIVPGAATALAILTDGGAGATTGNTGGTGSKGGDIIARVLGELNLGGSTTIAAPNVPTAPTTGNTPLTSPTTGTPGSTTGTVIISGNVSVATGTSPATFQTTNGDIVVSGTLRTVILGGTQNDIVFSAPAGTVYITGSVITSSSDGTPSGDIGGNVAINAARIVITGTINTRGEAGTAAGGKGGDVNMTSTGGPIIITGSILTSGGTGTTGGDGGIFSLLAATALQIFGDVTTEGGEATDTSATKPVGGKGGNITLSAGSSIDVSSTITAHGGDANGGTGGADGGDGATFNVNGTVPVKIYGTLDVRGGTAGATSIGGGSLIGGLGGLVDLGNTGADLESLELGRGTWSTIGGSGVDAVGVGGAMDFQTNAGPVSLGSDLDSRGGSTTGTLNIAGGTGGDVTIIGDNSAATNHVLAVNSDASVLTTGGAGSGSGNGGNGGAVTFQSGGDITLPIAMTTTGGTSVTGSGGTGGDITITVANGGSTPLGDVLMTGLLTTTGGVSDDGPGGDGGKVIVDTSAAAIGDITSSADITTSGTAGTTGAATGGTPGDITFVTDFGNISVSGTLTANGGDGITTPGNGATIEIKTGAGGGGITSSAAIISSGGSSLANGVDVAGGTGGTIHIWVQNTAGTIRLELGSALTADGGSGTGPTVAGNGGTGGTVEIRTFDQLVSITGTILARGGNQSGGGSGGQGGHVAVLSDFDNAGAMGDITLNANSSIDVSSGTGTAGGSARNNGGGAVDPTNSAVVAVIFDAARNTATSPDAGTEGVVRNLGTITARGRGTNGNGGDVYFDGVQPTPPGGNPLAGTQVLTGSGAGVLGDFLSD